MNTPDVTTIRLGLPLPLDVMGTLTSLIGSVYPGSTMSMGSRTADIHIHASERLEDPADLDTFKQFADEFTLDAKFAGMTDDAVRLALPAYLAQTFANMFIQVFADNPDAKNYLEFEVASQADPDQQWLVHVARSAGQTPNKLHLQAVAELADANSEISRLTALIEATP